MKRPTKRSAAPPHSVHGYVHAPKRWGVHPYFRRRDPTHDARADGQDQAWSVPDLCSAYHWPTDLAGGGVIAIVELGGGWIRSDIEAFFAGINQPVPSITDVSVDGTGNTPDSDPNGADGEVALDIQVAAAAYFAATRKPATIRVYWAKDIAPAVRAAAADGCDVCSISWGSDEANWLANGNNSAHEMEATAAAATAAGMVVFAASGDNNAADGGPRRANVDLPASCPHVIGCGGSAKTATSETVWNNNPGSADGQGTGGGYSTIFPMPSWQAGAPHGPGRMVPDVAADADPDTGYRIYLHGEAAVVGGTCAVAPLYAGLFAAFGTKLGFVTPELWHNHLCFNDITSGDNGKYRAKLGPDPCTGLGSPIGDKLAALMAHPAATAERELRQLQAVNQHLAQTIAALAPSTGVPTGCCTVTRNDGTGQQFQNITEFDCRVKGAVLGGAVQWNPGDCAG